ncbi:MAG TPA: hypothetical protein VIJ14_10745 [Rhabdochlamydiaceae bacterium]
MESKLIDPHIDIKQKVRKSSQSRFVKRLKQTVQSWESTQRFSSHAGVLSLQIPDEEICPDHIKILQPRQLFFPDTKTPPPPAIYATDIPAYAAARAFPWTAVEDVEICFEQNQFVLKVPSTMQAQLNQTVFLYILSSDKFQAVDIEPTGHYFRSMEAIKKIGKLRFETVVDAVERFGGIVIVKPYLRSWTFDEGLDTIH